MNFIAVDFETAQGKRWSICQIGIVKVIDDEIITRFHALIKPPNNEYMDMNIKVHKIKPEMTEFKPTFDKVWPEISHFFDGNLIISHNSDFDIDCLNQTLKYYNIPIPEFKFDCTYKLTGHKLSENCKAYEIDYYHPHDALNDAEACAELFIKINNGFIPDFSKVVKKKKMDIIYEGHDKLSGSILKKDLKNANSECIFYNKKVVFTGILNSIERNEAAKIVQSMGADIDTSISKKTNYVIVGSDAGPSKMKKIEDYNSNGAEIKIIYENDFLKIIGK